MVGEINGFLGSRALFPMSTWVGYQALEARDDRSIRIVMVNDEPVILDSFELMIGR